jgi:hypothetical protein
MDAVDLSYDGAEARFRNKFVKIRLVLNALKSSIQQLMNSPLRSKEDQLTGVVVATWTHGIEQTCYILLISLETNR